MVTFVPVWWGTLCADKAPKGQILLPRTGFSPLSFCCSVPNVVPSSDHLTEKTGSANILVSAVWCIPSRPMHAHCSCPRKTPSLLLAGPPEVWGYGQGQCSCSHITFALPVVPGLFILSFNTFRHRDPWCNLVACPGTEPSMCSFDFSHLGTFYYLSICPQRRSLLWGTAKYSLLFFFNIKKIISRMVQGGEQQSMLKLPFETRSPEIANNSQHWTGYCYKCIMCIKSFNIHNSPLRLVLLLPVCI